MSWHACSAALRPISTFLTTCRFAQAPSQEACLARFRTSATTEAAEFPGPGRAGAYSTAVVHPGSTRRRFLSLVAVVSGTASVYRSAIASSVKTSQVLRVAESDRFPNSRLAVLVYLGAVRAKDLADAIERRFASHGWKPAWRAGLYDFHHYHSTAHEVLGVFRGEASVRLGGPKGKLVQLSAGDVLVLPAGVAHKNERHSSNFSVVGAYPVGTSWDMKYGKPGERPATDRNITNTAVPGADPLQRVRSPGSGRS